MELRSTRRIVTGHDAKGKAVVLFDAPVKAKQRNVGGNGMTLLWTTHEFPVDVSGSADRGESHTGVPPAPNGTPPSCWGSAKKTLTNSALLPAMAPWSSPMAASPCCATPRRPPCD